MVSPAEHSLFSLHEEHPGAPFMYKPASIEDAPIMVLLESQADAIRLCRPIPKVVNRPETLQQFEDLLRQPTTWSRIAFDEETPVGFIIGCPADEPTIKEDRTDCDHVVALMVHPGHWRRGIGSGLLDWALDDLRTRKVTKLNLWTWISDNPAHTPAQLLYEQKGFRATGRSRMHPQIPDPQIEYEIDLS